MMHRQYKVLLSRLGRTDGHVSMLGRFALISSATCIRQDSRFSVGKPIDGTNLGWDSSGVELANGALPQGHSHTARHASGNPST